MDRIRFQFDEHIANSAALILRRQLIDIVAAAEAGVLGVVDSEVLARAHRELRVVMRDKDFLRLHAAGQPHSGIVFFGRGTRTVGQLIERLVLIHELMSSAEMIGHVEFV
jgi:predicted nuclease of predicted toxin-antitoxin system